MLEEIWKDVNGFEDNYMVSNFSVVKRKRRESIDVFKKKRVLKEKIIKPINSNGYHVIGLCVNGVKTTTKLHRIIAMAFIPNPENKPYINHINGIKTDNRIENLEWCTASENQKHAFKIGLQKSMKDRYPDPSLDPKNKKIYRFDLYGNKIDEFISIKSAAQYLGIKPEALSMCCNGKTRTCGGYRWRFSDLKNYKE